MNISVIALTHVMARRPHGVVRGPRPGTGARHRTTTHVHPVASQVPLRYRAHAFLPFSGASAPDARCNRFGDRQKPDARSVSRSNAPPLRRAESLLRGRPHASRRWLPTQLQRRVAARPLICGLRGGVQSASPPLYFSDRRRQRLCHFRLHRRSTSRSFRPCSTQHPYGTRGTVGRKTPQFCRR